jgi:hypothetical protein
MMARISTLRPGDMTPFVKSFIATFGGQAAAPATTTVTPTPSGATFVALRTPVGPVSVLAFTTPIPYPFGSERVGYLVKDLDAAVAAAVAAGARVLVAPFADPIGRDAIVRWPGGATMQFYWHNSPATLPPLVTIPEQRVYVSPERANAFVTSFLRFSKGEVLSDDGEAPGVEIGRPGETFRRVRVASEGDHSGRDRPGGTLQVGRSGSGDGPVSWWLHRGEPYGFAAVDTAGGGSCSAADQRLLAGLVDAVEDLLGLGVGNALCVIFSDPFHC